MSSTIEITKTCEWCGNTFIARKCTTRYCSKRCAEHAYKDAKRKEHVAREQTKADSPKGVEISPFISPNQCARLLGISRRSVYNYLAANSIPCFQFKGKTLISRDSLNSLFDGSHLYQLKPKKTQQPITEFYTSKEVQEKFGVSNSGMYKIAEREGWPKTQSRGKTLWSRIHVDKYFAGQNPQEEIAEWYTVADIQASYGMTLSAIYTLVSKEGIPKKKQGNFVMYSKYHFDLAKGATTPKEPEYYTYPEAMAKYGLTRDQLHHYLKYHNITRVKKGKYTHILRSELDSLLGSPEI